MTLLILAIFNGFAGYSLLDDQLSGTGLRIAYAIALSIPVIGTWIASLLFGGEFPGPDIIHRLYVIHILIVPADRRPARRVHLGILVRHKHTQFAGPGPARGQRRRRAAVADLRGQGPRPVLPDRRRCCACLGGLVQINPIWIFGPFDPAEVLGRVAARLVHGLARRRAAHHAGLGDPRLRASRSRTRSSPACCWPASRSRCCTPGRSSRPGVTGDHAEHHLLDRPRQRPVRTALGVADAVLLPRAVLRRARPT